MQNADTREIPLTRGYVAIVDAADYEWLSQHRWTYANGYATHYSREDGKVTSVYMHRLLLDAPQTIKVDHCNLNKLDNRRANLRLADNSQNCMNRAKYKDGASSRFKGVSFFKRTGRWMAGIGIQKQHIHLGYFDSEIEAAKAYDIAALAYHGEFAKLNFPNEVNHVR